MIVNSYDITKRTCLRVLWKKYDSSEIYEAAGAYDVPRAQPSSLENQISQLKVKTLFSLVAK
jgi:hypothetical protein